MYFIWYLSVQLLLASTDNTNIREDTPMKSKEVWRCPNCNCEMKQKSPQTSYVDLAEDNASQDMVEKNIPNFNDDYKLGDDAITNAFVGIITNKFAGSDFQDFIYIVFRPFMSEIDHSYKSVLEFDYSDSFTTELKRTEFKGLDNLKTDIRSLTIKDILSTGKEACLVKTKCQTSVIARDSIVPNTEIYTDKGNFDLERLSDTAVIHTAVIEESHKRICTIICQAVKEQMLNSIDYSLGDLIEYYSNIITKKWIEHIKQLTQGCFNAKIEEFKSLTGHDAAYIVKEACFAQKNKEHCKSTNPIDEHMQSETEKHAMSDDEGSCSYKTPRKKIKK